MHYGISLTSSGYCDRILEKVEEILFPNMLCQRLQNLISPLFPLFKQKIHEK